MKCPDCGLENIPGADDCAGCSASLVNAGSLTPKRGMEKKILEGTLSDLSPKKASLVSPEDPLLKAVTAMRAAKVGCVLAVENGRCVGILSERQLILNTPETQDLAQTPVKAVMYPNPNCLREDDEVAVVFNRMAFSGHLHAPVLFKDGSYGVVSARDLLRYLCK